jgi:hypothetical protein
MDHKDCPLQGNSHKKGVETRGDHAMGFNHELTHHHFRLYEDGGAIQVAPNASADTKSRDAIRSHLKMITSMFSAGNFSIPMFVHDVTVPGTVTMKQLKDQIIYTYQDMEGGGEVLIQARDPKAVLAIHNFLRFQIHDHSTGDPLTVSR